MTVKDLIVLLQAAPPEAEVLVDRGGAYDGAKSVEIYNAMPGKQDAKVFISSEEPS